MDPKDYKDAKAFAEEFAGTKWEITGSSSSLVLPPATYTGIIIGYLYGEYVIVDPDEPKYASGPVRGYQIYALYPERKIYELADPEAQDRFYYCSLQQLIKQVPARPKVVIKPYPHTCRRCKMPARKIGKVVLCSNGKCKSRAAMKKMYAGKVVKTVKTYKLSTGRLYYPDAWKNGGCVLCGKDDERGAGRNYAHYKCWDACSFNENRELVKELKVHV